MLASRALVLLGFCLALVACASAEGERDDTLSRSSACCPEADADAGAASFDEDGGAPEAGGSACLRCPLYEDGLPVLRLRTDPKLNRDGYTPAQIDFLGHAYQGAEAKYRGRSSFSYPKKSFTLKFDKHDPFRHVEAGFDGTRKVVLIGSFDDNSYLRQALAFELWNRTNLEHIQVRTSFVVLELDGAYHGLYLMADHIDRHLMREQGFSQDGNLYKARDHAADFRPTTGDGKPKSPHRGFTKEEGAPAQGEPDAFADLDAFVHWLDGAGEQELADGLASYIDVQDYGDWWIVVSLIDAFDSAGKNSYHYRDARALSPAGVFRCVPWDFNASFGQSWTTLRVPPTRTIERYQRMNEVFARLLASPAFSPAILARYRSLLEEELSLESVQAWIAEMREEIRVAAEHDQERWGEAYRSFSRFGPRDDLTDFAEESSYLDAWIPERWRIVAEQLEAR